VAIFSLFVIVIQIFTNVFHFFLCVFLFLTFVLLIRIDLIFVFLLLSAKSTLDAKTLIQAVQGTFKIHYVVAINPMQIYTRNVSCILPELQIPLHVSILI
jgi:signal recognition particle receptor subunit beta